MSPTTGIDGIVKIAAIPAAVVTTLTAAGAVVTNTPSLMYAATGSAALAMGCVTWIEICRRRGRGALDTSGVNDKYRELLDEAIANLKLASEAGHHDGFRNGVIRQIQEFVGKTGKFAQRSIGWDAAHFPHEFDLQVANAKSIVISLTPREAPAFHKSLLAILAEKSANDVPVTIIYVLGEDVLSPALQAQIDDDLARKFTVKKIVTRLVPRFQPPNGTQPNFALIARDDGDPKGPTLVTFHTDDNGYAFGDFTFCNQPIFRLYQDFESQLVRDSVPLSCAMGTNSNGNPGVGRGSNSSDSTKLTAPSSSPTSDSLADSTSVDNADPTSLEMAGSHNGDGLPAHRQI